MDLLEKKSAGQNNWQEGAILSLVVHLCLFLLFPKSFFSQEVSQKKTGRFQLEKIDAQELAKYRSVGVRNGSQYFSLPLQKTREQSPSFLSLESLQIEKPRVVSPSSKGPSLKTLRMTKKQRFEPDKKDILSQLTSDLHSKRLMKRSNLSIRFLPPEGVDEDELNSVEKMFWSFKKRTYMSYISSFIKTYNQFVLRRPQIKQAIARENHTIEGRIIFDANGNIVRIRITRPSPNDDFHQLFEETLKGIHKLPNPPQNILEGQQFTVYYQLRVNT